MKAEEFFEWIIDAPPWAKGLCGLLMITVGIGIIALSRILEVHHGAGVGGAFIGFGVALIVLWANDA